MKILPKGGKQAVFVYGILKDSRFQTEFPEIIADIHTCLLFSVYNGFNYNYSLLRIIIRIYLFTNVINMLMIPT